MRPTSVDSKTFYTNSKSFRCNTYRKPREGELLLTPAPSISERGLLWLTSYPVRIAVLSEHRDRRIFLHSYKV